MPALRPSALAAARRSARDWRGPTGSDDGGFELFDESCPAAASNRATRSASRAFSAINLATSAPSNTFCANASVNCSSTDRPGTRSVYQPSRAQWWTYRALRAQQHLNGYVLTDRHFVAAFTHATVGMAIVGLDGNFLDVNESLCRILGLSREDLRGRSMLEVTDPRDHALGAEDLRRLVAGETDSVLHEKRYISGTGATVVVRLSVAVVRDESGQPLHFVSQMEDITEANLSRRRLEASEARFRWVFDKSPVAMCLVRSRGSIQAVNDSFAELVGLSLAEPLGRPLTDFLDGPSDFDINCSAGDEQTVMGEHLLVGSKPERWVVVKSTCLDPMGQSDPELVVQLVDLTERREKTRLLNRQLLVAVACREIAAADAPEKVQSLLIERSTALLSTLPSARVTLFLAEADGFSTVGSGGVDPEVTRQLHLRRLPERVQRSVDADEPCWLTPPEMEAISEELRLPPLNPHTFMVPLRAGGECVGVLTAAFPDPPARDFTDAITVLATEAAAALENLSLRSVLAHQARHDPLTGLLNRAAFGEQLQQMVTSQAAAAGSGAAVLFLDIDDFKAVNDGLGHAAGDQVLVTVAARLSRCLRPTDLLARLGGDEFCALLQPMVDERQAFGVAHRMRQALSQPVALPEATAPCSASIGVAMWSPGMSPAELLSRADAAMYLVKRADGDDPASLDPVPTRVSPLAVNRRSA